MSHLEQPAVAIKTFWKVISRLIASNFSWVKIYLRWKTHKLYCMHRHTIIESLNTRERWTQVSYSFCPSLFLLSVKKCCSSAFWELHNELQLRRRSKSFNVFLSASKHLDVSLWRENMRKQSCYSRGKSSMECLNIVFAFSLINKPLLNHSFCKPLIRQVCKRKMVSAYQRSQNPYSHICSKVKIFRTRCQNYMWPEVSKGKKASSVLVVPVVAENFVRVI